MSEYVRMITDRSQNWLPYLAKYEVSDGGLMRCVGGSTNSLAGRLLLPTLVRGLVIYSIRDRRGGPAPRSHHIVPIVKDFFGVELEAMPGPALDELRAAISFANQGLIHPPKPGKGGGGSPRGFVCRFNTNTTSITEFPSFKCTQVDPFGSGQPYPRLDLKGWDAEWTEYKRRNVGRV